MGEVHYDWTLESIREVESDSEDRGHFTEGEARKIASLCAQLRTIVKEAQSRVGKVQTTVTLR